MGIKSAQGELNQALTPIFAHIPKAHQIHDDLIIGTKDHQEHEEVLLEVMQAISRSGLTLNASKCEFGKSEIEFWGMRIGEYGVKPDPAKVEALEHLKPSNTKEELVSFLCMLQSNADFIQNFAQKSAVLRELTKISQKFVWERKHNDCFISLLTEFKKDMLLRYFDINKQTFIFADAHISGLGAMLAQGVDITSAKPIAFAFRTTTPAESHYPQLDIEVMALDFGMRRFRNYIVGSPKEIILVTDHKPLCSVFNGKRQ